MNKYNLGDVVDIIHVYNERKTASVIEVIKKSEYDELGKEPIFYYYVLDLNIEENQIPEVYSEYELKINLKYLRDKKLKQIGIF